MKAIDHTDEKELLLLLRDGDNVAFDQVYRKFQPALVFFAKRLLFSHNLHEAEEIVQDTLLKCHDRASTFETMAQIKSFLYVAAKNSCLQLIEKEKVRARRYEGFMDKFEESEDLIINEIIHTEAVRQLREEIEKLPVKCREIMERLVYEDKTPNETADELGISVSTVHNQKARAISILKKRLSGTGFVLLLSYL